jgi:hypothetical protein
LAPSATAHLVSKILSNKLGEWNHFTNGLRLEPEKYLKGIFCWKISLLQ